MTLALTIWQPWASLIVGGYKPFEFRSWRVPNHLVGQRIVIHSARRPIAYAEVRALCMKLAAGGQQAAATCLRPEAFGYLKLVYAGTTRPPLGCGIGTAVLGETVDPRLILDEFGSEHPSGIDGCYNWGWPMLQVERWDRSIPARGKQGFWRWPKPEDIITPGEAV